MVTALAGLGDERALPGLLTALDTGVDEWRAVRAAGHLPQAAGELLPRLTRRLADADFSSPWGLMGALGRLGDPAAVPALVTALSTAVEQEQWRTAAAALRALGAFGSGAAPALGTVRPLADADDPQLRFAGHTERDPADAVPRLTALLDTDSHEAADALGRIGAPAAAALPRLRQLLDAGHAWTRTHAAAAIHDIAGPAEAAVVLPVLLRGWESNDSTARHVLECLQRMGPAAAPALPRVRAELALTRRSGGFFDGIEYDEALLRACRAVIRQPAGPGTRT
ncbi:HEAT repeat domain-containing protein [Kitasatospora sp. NPDC001309]|uniref:HEAT repeat domain-containing protein n=1 Tax=Kitasatospora sp. NPDC001309 TaxID=3364013 RepID=UPI0036BC620A